MKISLNNNVYPVKQQTSNNHVNHTVLNGTEPDTFRRSNCTSPSKVQFKGWFSKLFDPNADANYPSEIKTMLVNKTKSLKGKETMVNTLIDDLINKVPATQKRRDVFFDIHSYLDWQGPDGGARLTHNMQTLINENPDLPQSVEKNPVKAVIKKLLIPFAEEHHDIFTKGFIEQCNDVIKGTYVL